LLVTPPSFSKRKPARRGRTSRMIEGIDYR
jgi:hypothetical protein